MKKVSIKTRLLILTLLPIIAVLALGVGRLFHDIGIKENLLSTQKRVQEALLLAGLTHSLQIERGLSAGYIASGSHSGSSELKAIRLTTDADLAKLKTLLEQHKSDASITASLSELSTKRSNIDKLEIDAVGSTAYYTTAIAHFISSATKLPLSVEDPQTAMLLSSYAHLASLKENLGQMRALLNGAASRGHFKLADFSAFNASYGRFLLSEEKFKELSPSNIASMASRSEATFAMINKAQNTCVGSDLGIDPSIWFRDVSLAIDSYKKIEDELLKVTNSIIDEKVTDADFVVVALSIAILLGSIIFVSIILLLIRVSVTKPIEEFKTTLINIGDNHDLTIKVNEEAPTEIAQMAKSFNSLIANLRELIDTSKIGSSENASISHELSTTAISVGENV
ncbi:MAG: nitrate- and nitrite sensing domain-containing protein, partial [Sulfuricurvum sp.]